LWQNYSLQKFKQRMTKLLYSFKLALIFFLGFTVQLKAQKIQEGLPFENKSKNLSQKNAYQRGNNGIYLKDFNQEALQRTGKIRCYSVEYNEQLRKNNPNFDRDFEAWIAKAIAKRRRDIANGNASTRTIGGVYYIPVVVHVIHNGEAIGTGSNISDAQVQDQINVLNEDFRKMAGTPGWNTHPEGADTRIEFVLAKRTPAGAATNGINRVNRNTLPNNATNWQPGFEATYINGTIKPNTIWNPDEYMNMWTVQFGGADAGLLGYAQFPESPIGGVGCGAANANTDGLVMGYQYFGRGLGGPYGDGRTATHEIGHGLGLRHIWGDGGCGVDDFCADTPTAGAANFGCPNVNSCTDTPVDFPDMKENYMDYTDDLCMNIFTNDQATRMRTVIENSPRRKTLLTSPALLAPATNYGGIVDIVSPLGNVCGTFTPTVILRNLGSNNLTSATISYQIDGGSTQTFAWSGSLAYKATANVNLPTQTLSTGNHSIRVWVSVSNGSSHSSDMYVNEIISNFSVGAGNSLPFEENFESNAFPPTNWYIEQNPLNCNTWFEQTGDNGTNGATVARLPLGDGGADDILYSPLIDLTSASGNVTLSFDVFKNNGGNARLRVDIQPCGSATWTNLFDQQGNTLSNDAWASKSVNLSTTYNGQLVRLRFLASSVNTTGFLRLDNIRVIDQMPRVSFVNTTSTTAENNTNAPLVGDCRPFVLVNIPVQINLAPTGSVVVGLNVTGGTAINGVDFDIVNSTLTFPAASTANQNFQLRIYDDPALEVLENITFGLTIVSGTAQISTSNNTHTLSMSDNDNHPQPSAAGATLFSENFESGAAAGWTQYTTSGAVNIWRVGTQRVLNGTYSAYISQSAASGNYDATVTGAALLRTPVINATAYPNNQLRVTFDFQCNGERAGITDYDYGSLYYSLASSPTTWVQIEGANPSPYRGVTTTTTRIVNLPAALQGQQFHLAWRWDNDNSVANQPAFVIDNIVVEALPFTGTAVETNTFTAPAMANRLYLGPNSLNYAYNPANGRLVARIENTTSHNYGCTQVYVDRAGTGAVQFTTTSTAEYLASKTIRVIPATNNPTGAYNMRLYYTNAEVTGWETATGQNRTAAVVHKYAGAISSATIGSPSTQSSPTSQGTFGADFWIEGGFTNGFSGFGMGLPPNPLPVQLVDFTTQTQVESIRLLWRVVNELNIERYVVEKSYNAKEFFPLGTINAQSVENYELWDNNPKFGKNYYRLRIEEAGKITYSNIVVAEWGKGTTISVYPNPASEKIYLTMASFENTPVNLRLVNPLGQEIWGENVSVAINENYRKEISLASLAKGVYILEVTTLGGKQTYKLIIQ
jgi:hypothetical protein